MLFQLYQKDATTSTVAPVASTCDCTNSQPNYLMNMYTKDATSTACSCDDTVAPVAPVVPTTQPSSVCDCTQPNYLMNMYTKDATSTDCNCDDTTATVVPTTPVVVPTTQPTTDCDCTAQPNYLLVNLYTKDVTSVNNTSDSCNCDDQTAPSHGPEANHNVENYL